MHITNVDVYMISRLRACKDAYVRVFTQARIYVREFMYH